MEDCILCKIAKGELPSTKYLETDKVLVIKNINPEAPFHALIFPKEHLELEKATEDYAVVLGELLLAAPELARKEKTGNGYRLIINTGPDSGREMEHLHLHFLAGEPLGPLLSV